MEFYVWMLPRNIFRSPKMGSAAGNSWRRFGLSQGSWCYCHLVDNARDSGYLPESVCHPSRPQPTQIADVPLNIIKVQNLLLWANPSQIKHIDIFTGFQYTLNFTETQLMCKSREDCPLLQTCTPNSPHFRKITSRGLLLLVGFEVRIQGNSPALNCTCNYHTHSNFVCTM